MVSISSLAKPNDDILTTRYKRDFVQELKDYNDYTELQRTLRDKNWVKGSDSTEINPEVSDNLRWNIHRWSMWDYIKDWDYPYYCKVLEYNGSEKCVPLTKKRFCTISRLYTDPYKCLKTIKKQSQ